MRNLGFVLGSALILALAGCGDDGRAGGDGGMDMGDGGPDIVIDAGPDAGGNNGGDDGGNGSGGDGGTSQMQQCVSQIESMSADAVADMLAVPSEAAPYCSTQEDGTATSECLSGCFEGGTNPQQCLTGCLDGDTTEPKTVQNQMIDCGSCWNNQLVVCTARNGCKSEVAAFLCCTQVQCGNAANPQQCITNNCGDARSAVQQCIPQDPCLSNVTGGDYSVCFPDSTSG
jgi:hypothetical protein